MSFFDQLEWTNEDKTKLFTKVRSCNGKWGSTRPELIELRDRLLLLQRYRCAYCQVPIDSNLVGYRELDHILPKDGKSQSLKKKISSLEKDRYCTHGYPEFTFEPRNIALACKPCNSSKGTWDALKNRNILRPLRKYPARNRLNWFHPHFQKYKDHVRITEDFLYEGQSDEGRELIRVCGLSKVETLEKKFGPAALRVTQTERSIYECVESLINGLKDKNFGKSHAINALVSIKHTSKKQAEEIIDQGLLCKNGRQRDLLKVSCDTIERRISIPRTLNSSRAKKALK